MRSQVWVMDRYGITQVTKSFCGLMTLELIVSGLTLMLIYWGTKTGLILIGHNPSRIPLVLVTIFIFIMLVIRYG